MKIKHPEQNNIKLIYQERENGGDSGASEDQDYSKNNNKVVTFLFINALYTVPIAVKYNKVVPFSKNKPPHFKYRFSRNIFIILTNFMFLMSYQKFQYLLEEVSNMKQLAVWKLSTKNSTCLLDDYYQNYQKF